jgi:methionyl-tRNA formyltransferase
MSLRLVMFGTGDFAVPTLAGLIAGPHEVLALYTQPERTGAGHHQHGFAAIKQLALDHGVPVHQPDSVNDPTALDELRRYEADLFIVAAYGQILSRDFLAIPRRGSYNVHASLLPKYRGASPINHAIWRGDEETGVTIIAVVPALDAGTMFAKAAIPILSTDTTATLEPKLAALGPGLVHDVLARLEAGTLTGEEQDPALVSKAPKLRKTMGQIDWSQTTRQIDCQVRALQPWPVAFTHIPRPGKPSVRILVLEVQPVAPATAASSPAATPGTVLDLGKHRLVIQTADGPLEITRLQPEGKRPMPTADFLRGTPVAAGTIVSSTV